MRIEEFRLLNGFINRFCGIKIDDDMRFVAERKLSERVSALGLSSFGDYYHYLRYHPDKKAELERAVDVLTTNETYFFREFSQLVAFRDEVLPRLRELAARKRSLTIWSAGCSSGEEVYTLAILISQSGLFKNWDVRIFGNDISRRVIQNARRAIYSASSFRATPAEYECYFIDTPEGKMVDPSVRSMCHFGHFNLLDDARAVMVGRVEAIFCRNVLIYFDQTARKNVIQTFYQRLCPGGYLMLGHSESLLHDSTAFELAHLLSDLVYRKPLSARSLFPPEMVKR
ncbi:MAG: protein-glutamate O-methyltransferase CheR [Deltaproteobacteria bacterium]|nr:protein-glutamate O-methyltransferase CheR [Deltaproteobacteria bacterium]